MVWLEWKEQEELSGRSKQGAGGLLFCTNSQCFADAGWPTRCSRISLKKTQGVPSSDLGFKMFILVGV